MNNCKVAFSATIINNAHTIRAAKMILEQWHSAIYRLHPHHLIRLPIDNFGETV